MTKSKNFVDELASFGYTIGTERRTRISSLYGWLGGKIIRIYGGNLIMFVKEVSVKNQVGLHARPATFFIQKANEYKSSIWVEKEERRVNAKSLLGILSLGIVGGTTIRIIADGSDEQLAVDGLVNLVESVFAESFTLRPTSV